ncbi:glycosyltransferase family 2 protein [Desulfonatronum thioautotrophicum]|uniref:glycosyltransferase family 2 protein n=1 Tax=Desulfonatronum thioautotrophicum TaxID=617001 RepID=UPI00069B031C|nr:glycosyltransferase [Desulfonatronum thioautotrophicum]
MHQASPMLPHDIPFWHMLPEPLQDNLLLGSVGKLHLVTMAEQALGQAVSGASPTQASFCVSLGLDMLLAAWEEDPLDGQLAGQLLMLQQKLPGLPEYLIEIFRYVAQKWQPPEQNAYYARLVQRRETEKMCRFLEQMLGKDQDNLYWWQQALMVGPYEQEWEWIQHCMDHYWPAAMPLLGQRIRAELRILQGLPVSDRMLDTAREIAMSPACGQRLLGDLAYTEGNRDQALHHWRQTLRLRPWQTGLILKMHDALLGVDRERTVLPGKTMILLYSFNKADELAVTLDSLQDSRLHGATVAILDNASSDQTPDLLRGRQDRLGPERFQVISLPVNIGAPAARNWLMHLPECREADWLVYLDDDVSLPEDWLERLGAARGAYPEAGVWGCKVVDFHNPASIQSADLHVRELKPTDRPDASQSWTSFRLSNLHHQVLDQGQFSYMRPCSSVTGCCHLFARDVLLECGDFDLRFSPSQFDDLDHDLRLNLNGRPAVYTGHLEIGHLKRTGRATLNNTQQYGSAMANEYKLHHNYAQEQVERIANLDRAATRVDLLAKVQTMAEHGDLQEWT